MRSIILTVVVVCCLMANSTLHAELVLSDFNFDALYTVDETNGSASLRSSVSPDMYGLAFDSASQTLFGSSLDELYVVDADTGGTSLIGSFGVSGVQGLAVQSGSGALFGVTNTGGSSSAFVSIDRNTGAATPISSIAGRFASLTYVPATNLLYTVDNNSGTLVSIDPLTGGSNTIGSFAYGATGIAYDISTDRILSVDPFFGILQSINYVDGTRTSIGITRLGGSFGGPSGLAKVTAIPEPSTWVLLGTCSLIGPFRRVRGKKCR